MRYLFIIWFLCISALQQSALASAQNIKYNDEEFIDAATSHNKDPFEKVNRRVFAVNKVIDKLIFKPINLIYTQATPQIFRKLVHNILNNLSEPLNIINAVIQGNPDKFSTATGRFLLNSTWGLVGINDVASYAGMKYSSESFGRTTLRRYKIDSGPYLFLPIIGPSSARDVLGIVADIAMDPFTHIMKKDARYAGLGATFVDSKSSAISTINEIEQIALDEYAFIRSSYMQKYR
jgi:phospholipid-binding lipoprotein MlaA